MKTFNFLSKYCSIKINLRNIGNNCIYRINSSKFSSNVQKDQDLNLIVEDNVVKVSIFLIRNSRN